MPTPTRSLRSWLWAGALVALAAPASAGYVTFGNGLGSKWDQPVHPNPATISWGFVPDGTAIDPSFPLAPEVVGTSQVGALRSAFDAEYGGGAFDAALQRAFDTWELVAGVDFVGPVADAGQLAIGGTGATSPDIRIGAFTAVSGSGFSFLGAVGYGPPGDDVNFPDPVAGDLIFNLSSSFAIHPGVEDDLFYAGGLYRNDLEGLVLHELGHAAMGLGHPAAGIEEVMYVGAGCCVTINRIPSPDDIAGARSVYGNSATPACDNGIDDDGDGATDYPADPGCWSASDALEKPQCQDGLDNDGQVGIDYDGGDALDIDPRDGFIDAQFNPASPAVEAADPECVGKPWKNKEKAGCGLGFELVFLAPALTRLARLRRRIR